jgi:adiponectin receptor
MKDRQKPKENRDSKDNINSKYEGKTGIILGTYNDLPDYYKDNEYIRKGYLLYCDSIFKALKSLFHLHNESVNIWSHLLGAIFFFCLILYTAIFITNFRAQYFDVKNGINNMDKITKNIPYLPNNFFKSFIQYFKSFKIDFNNFNLRNYKGSFLLLNESFEKMSNHFDNLTTTFHGFIDSLNKRFIELREKLLDLMELEHISFGTDINDIYINRAAKKLKRWPLFIFLISAILCLSFSATFHLIGCVSKTYHKILSRFDYGGIAILVTGSCFPPYYYFFYCEPQLSVFYLVFISTFGLTTFCLSLTNNFNSPQMRSFRGKLFIIFGLSAGIPVIHIKFFGDNLKGFHSGIKIFYWFIGGVTYVLGGLIYITRFPERKYPGKFDYIGSSHQLFHITVVVAAYFHYLGSLDAYYARFYQLC